MATPTTESLPKLHHITLQTNRLQELIDWYAVVVGTRVTHRAGFGAWLTNDEANHRIAVVVPGTVQDRPGEPLFTGMRHVAFEFGTFDALMEHYARVRDQSIVPQFCIDHGPTISMYYQDPDGNVVELQMDTFEDWALSAAFMAESSEFHDNPRGKDFDPEVMHAAWQAGAGLAEVHQRAYAGEFAPASATSH